MISTSHNTSSDVPPSVALSGASGFLGTSLATYLTQRGYTVYRMVRSETLRGEHTIYWNYDRNEIDLERLEGIDFLIHLAGENILQWPWTEEIKRRIYDSRVLGTTFLSTQIAQLSAPPRVFLSASGVSYYGDRGNHWVDEDSGMDTSSFLAGVCKHWEAALQPARSPVTRTASLRIGIVLDRKSRIIKQILPLFSMGLGAKLRPANPFISWISLADTIRSIEHILHNNALVGPINIVSPNPVTQNEFADTLAQLLHRPLFLNAPSFLIERLLGELGRETVLSSTRVRPTRLLNSGFRFEYSTLPLILKEVLQD